jgi:hypothetical protein
VLKGQRIRSHLQNRLTVGRSGTAHDSLSKNRCESGRLPAICRVAVI